MATQVTSRGDGGTQDTAFGDRTIRINANLPPVTTTAPLTPQSPLVVDELARTIRLQPPSDLHLPVNLVEAQRALDEEEILLRAAAIAEALDDDENEQAIKLAESNAAKKEAEEEERRRKLVHEGGEPLSSATNILADSADTTTSSDPSLAPSTAATSTLLLPSPPPSTTTTFATSSASPVARALGAKKKRTSSKKKRSSSKRKSIKPPQPSQKPMVQFADETTSASTSAATSTAAAESTVASSSEPPDAPLPEPTATTSVPSAPISSLAPMPPSHPRINTNTGRSRRGRSSNKQSPSLRVNQEKQNDADRSSSNSPAKSQLPSPTNASRPSSTRSTKSGSFKEFVYTPRMHVTTGRSSTSSHSSDSPTAASSTTAATTGTVTFLTGVDLVEPPKPSPRSGRSTRSHSASSHKSSMHGEEELSPSHHQQPSTVVDDEEGLVVDEEGDQTDEFGNEYDPVSRLHAELTDFADWLTDDVPYRLQGDESFYTPEALKARGELVKHPKILRWIDKFWKSIRGLDMKFGLMRDEFVTLQIKMAKVLDPQWTIADSERTAIAEYQREVGKSIGLSKEKFFRSLFELVDTWTSTIQAEDYIYFLSSLFKRLTITKTKVVHGYIAGIGPTGSTTVKYYEYRDLKDVRPWKETPFFYQESDKKKYRRLQELKHVGPVLAESSSSEEGGEDDDSDLDEDELRARAERAAEKKAAEIKAAKEAAEAERAAEAAAKAKAEQDAAIARVLAIGKTDSTEVPLILPEGFDPDAIIGHVEGEDVVSNASGESDGGKGLFENDQDGWPSEVESEKGDADEQFYGKSESEYATFVKAPARIAQPVEHHKPKPPSEAPSTAPVEVVLTEEEKKAEAMKQHVAAVMRKQRQSISANPQQAAFPEWLMDGSGTKSRPSSSPSGTDADGKSLPLSSLDEHASASGGDEGSDVGTNTGGTRTPNIILGEDETLSPITGRARKKFKVKQAKAAHAEAEQALKATMESLATWEAIQQKFGMASDEIETYEQRLAREKERDLVKEKRLKAKKAKEHEQRLVEIAKMRAAKEAKKKAREEKEAAAEQAEANEPEQKEESPPVEGATQPEDNSEAAILARLSKKRKESRKSVTGATLRGRILHHRTTSASSHISLGTDYPENEYVLDSSTPVAPLLSGDDVKVTNMSMPLVARPISKAFRGSEQLHVGESDATDDLQAGGKNWKRKGSVKRPVKRPSIFTLLPDLAGPIDPFNLGPQVGKTSSTGSPTGDDAIGPDGWNETDPTSSHITGVHGRGTSSTSSLGTASKVAEGGEFNSTAFFDAVGQSATQGTNFIPFSQRDRVSGKAGTISTLNPTSIGSAGRTFCRGQGSKIQTAGSKKKKKKRSKKKASDDEDIFGGLSMGVDEDEPTTGKKGRKKKGGKAGKADIKIEIPTVSLEVVVEPPAPPPIEVPDLFLANRPPELDDDGNPIVVILEEGEEDLLKDGEGGVPHSPRPPVPEEIEDDDFAELDRLAAKLEEAAKAKAAAEATKAAAEEAAKAPVVVENLNDTAMSAVDGSEEDQTLLASLLAEADISLNTAEADKAAAEAAALAAAAESAASSATNSTLTSPRLRPEGWAPETNFQTPEMLAAIALQKERENDEVWQAQERKRIAQLLGLDSSSEEEEEEDEHKKMKRRLRKKIIPLLTALKVQRKKKVNIAFGRITDSPQFRPHSRQRRPSQVKERTQLQKDLAELLDIEDENLDTIAAALEGEAEAKALLASMAEARARSRAASLMATPDHAAAIAAAGGASPPLHDVLEEGGVLGLDGFELGTGEIIPLEQLPPLPPSPSDTPVVSAPATAQFLQLPAHDAGSAMPGPSPTTDIFNFDFRLPATPLTGMFKAESASMKPITGFTFPDFTLNRPAEGMLDGETSATVTPLQQPTSTPEIPSSEIPPTDTTDATADEVIPVEEESQPVESSMTSGPHWSQTLEAWSPLTRGRLVRGGITEPEIQSAVEVVVKMNLHEQEPTSAVTASVSRRSSTGLSKSGLPKAKDEDSSSLIHNARQAWLIRQMQQGALDAQARQRQRERAREERRAEKERLKQEERDAILAKEKEDRARLEQIVEADVILPEFVPEYHPSEDEDDTSSSIDTEEEEAQLSNLFPPLNDAPLVMPAELAALPPVLAPQPKKVHPARPRLDANELIQKTVREIRLKKEAQRAAVRKERDHRLSLLVPRQKKKAQKKSILGVLHSSDEDTPEMILVDNGPVVQPVTKQTKLSTAVFGVRNAPMPTLRVDADGLHMETHENAPATVAATSPKTGPISKRRRRRSPGKSSDSEGGDVDEDEAGSPKHHSPLRRGFVHRQIRNKVILTQQELEEKEKEKASQVLPISGQQVTPIPNPNLPDHSQTDPFSPLHRTQYPSPSISVTINKTVTNENGVAVTIPVVSSSEPLIHPQFRESPSTSKLPEEEVGGSTLAIGSSEFIPPNIVLASSRVQSIPPTRSSNPPLLTLQTTSIPFTKRQGKSPTRTTKAEKEPLVVEQSSAIGDQDLTQSSEASEQLEFSIVAPPEEAKLSSFEDPNSNKNRKTGIYSAIHHHHHPGAVPTMADSATLPSRESRAMSRPPKTVVSGMIRVAPSKNRLQAAAEIATMMIEQRDTDQAQDTELLTELQSWERTQVQIQAREERRRKLRNRHNLSPEEFQAELKAEAAQRQELRITSNTFGGQMTEEKTEMSLAADSGLFGQFHVIERPSTTPSNADGLSYVDPFSINGANVDQARVGVANPLAYFGSATMAAPSTATGRPATVATISTNLNIGGLVEDANKPPAPWMNKLRIAKGTAISVRASAHQSEAGMVEGINTYGPSLGVQVPDYDPSIMPPSSQSTWTNRGTFSRAGAGSQSRGHTSSGSRFVDGLASSHNNRHHHVSPPRGIPTFLPALVMPSPPTPVHSFSMSPTAQQDINEALRGTLVSPRFIAAPKPNPEQSMSKSKLLKHWSSSPMTMSTPPSGHMCPSHSFYNHGQPPLTTTFVQLPSSTDPYYPSGSMSARGPQSDLNSFRPSTSSDGSQTHRIRIQTGAAQVNVGTLSMSKKSLPIARPPPRPHAATSDLFQRTAPITTTNTKEPSSIPPLYPKQAYQVNEMNNITPRNRTTANTITIINQHRSDLRSAPTTNL